MLKTQTLEWFYNNVRKRFKRFGSAKVLKTLYRKHLVEHSALSELTGKAFKHFLNPPHLVLGSARASRADVIRLFKYHFPCSSTCSSVHICSWAVRVYVRP